MSLYTRTLGSYVWEYNECPPVQQQYFHDYSSSEKAARSILRSYAREGLTAVSCELPGVGAQTYRKELESSSGIAEQQRG